MAARSEILYLIKTESRPRPERMRGKRGQASQVGLPQGPTADRMPTVRRRERLCYEASPPQTSPPPKQHRRATHACEPARGRRRPNPQTAPAARRPASWHSTVAIRDSLAISPRFARPPVGQRRTLDRSEHPGSALQPCQSWHSSLRLSVAEHGVTRPHASQLACRRQRQRCCREPPKPARQCEESE